MGSERRKFVIRLVDEGQISRFSPQWVQFSPSLSKVQKFGILNEGIRVRLPPQKDCKPVVSSFNVFYNIDRIVRAL